jgi:hypothetical protein
VSNEGSLISALTIGTSREVLTASPQSPLSKLLQGLTQDVIDQITKRMEHYDVSASNHLKQNTKLSKVEVKGSTIKVGISSDFYWKFINYGVNGSKVNHGAPNWGATPSGSLSMSESMKAWEMNRGITSVNGRYTNWTSLSKVEGMSMAERGQKPRPYFSDVVNDRLKDTLRTPIEKLLKRSIEIIIVEPWQ